MVTLEDVALRGRTYAQFPEFTTSFYAPPPPDPMMNLQSATWQQHAQLNAAALLPPSFLYDVPVAPEGPGERSWRAFAPTRAGFGNYIMASGASRNRVIERSNNTKLGARNLLRDTPAVPLTATQPWFNDSPYRTDLVLAVGCNPARF